MEGLSLILGMQWLQHLGQVTHDYANHSMEFRCKGHNIKLKGEETLMAQLNSFNQLRVINATKAVNQNLESYFWPTSEILAIHRVNLL